MQDDDRGPDPTEKEKFPDPEFQGKARTVGRIAHIPTGLMGAMLAGIFVNEMRRANIFQEEPLRYTDPIRDNAQAEATRREIDAHQTRMQAAEDKRVRKAEKLRKSNVQHQDKK